jgi:uncharacterized RDD family membrane protein YckC
MDLMDIQNRISDLTDKEIIDTLKLGKDELQSGVHDLYINEAIKRQIDYVNIPIEGIKKFFYAHTWKRFVNYLIDFYGIYFLGVIIFSVPVRKMILSPVLCLLIIFTFQLIYYFLLEYKLNKTIGKIFTHTTILMIDGSKPTMKTIIIRTLSRFIPFNTLVTLFTGISIHDRISKTRCYNDKDVNRIIDLSTL